MKKKDFAINKPLYYLKSKIEAALSNRITSLFTIILILILLLFGRYFKQIFFVTVLIVLGSISVLYNRIIRMPLGIELCILATVLCSIKYGPLIGGIVWFVSLFFSFVLSRQFQYKSFISLFAIEVIAVSTFLISR